MAIQTNGCDTCRYAGWIGWDIDSKKGECLWYLEHLPTSMCTTILKDIYVINGESLISDCPTWKEK